MPLPDLPDRVLLDFARCKLRLRNAVSAIRRPGPVRQAVLLAYYAEQRRTDPTLQRTLRRAAPRTDFKRLAAGDALDD